MAIYEIIPTIKLSKNNKLISPTENLPELVHLDDDAKTIFIDFTKVLAATVSPQVAIDLAIQEMKALHQQMLLVEDAGQVVGLLSYQDVVSERPLRLMHEKKINRSEVIVEMLMKPRDQILAIDAVSLKHAQVGHIIKTLKKHSANYLLVVKKQKNGKHLIKGLFSASQIGKQLHSDLSSLLTKTPETIIELHKERKT